MIIIGSAQTGKTTILQNVIRSLSEQYTPDEVAIYIIDFASMVLKNFETLNHVGGVVSSSEDEKLKNLFKMLWEEMETRKEKLLSVGVSSFVAYKEAGRTDMKQIVLIIDNLTALKELYFQDDDELLNLCREGITVGISIVIANAQTAGIGYKYLSSFSNRIALFCNDGNEYSAILNIVTGDLSIFREDVSQKWINRYLNVRRICRLQEKKNLKERKQSADISKNETENVLRWLGRSR